MSNGRKSVLQPMTEEQLRRESELSAGLCDAEREAVVKILSEDRTPAGLMHVLNNATGFAETMAAKFRHPKTPRVDCKEGCTWCCYQTVPVTAPEAFAIADFIRSPESTQPEARIAKLVDVVEKTKGMTPRERTKSHIPCAFLERSRCSIYPVRPLACSEFTSMDVNDCKRAYRVGFKPRGIIHEKARMIAFYAVRQGLLEGLRESLPEANPEHYELVAAVIAAGAPSAAESWLAGNNIFSGTSLFLEQPTAKKADGEQPSNGA